MSSLDLGADAAAREVLASERPHLITVDEYHRMLEAGILDEDDRVELLEGVIVEVSPQSEAHAKVIIRLTRLLNQSLGDEFEVRPQVPLTLGDRNEPEPDLAVVATIRSTGDRHPSSALLVVEVAGDSLAKDRNLKTALYARASIAEYWIVNLATRAVEVHRTPDSSGRYAHVSTAGENDDLSATSLPGVRFPVRSLFA